MASLVDGAGGAGGIRIIAGADGEEVHWAYRLIGSIRCLCWAWRSVCCHPIIGIFMGTIARSMPQLGLLVILVLLPLSKVLHWFHTLNKYLLMVQDIMLTMPTTHFVSLAQAILYRCRIRNRLAAVSDAGDGNWRRIFTIALLRFRKTIGTMA